LGQWGLGDLHAPEDDRAERDDLGEQPPAAPQLLVEEGDAEGDADQRVANGEHRLRGDQRPGLQRVLQ
jgi:hypothetical protein